MSKTFKKVFQPVEKAFKAMLGIKKLKKGKLFDEEGFLGDAREKITRYALFVPFFQKLKVIVSVSKAPSCAVNVKQGGGDCPLHDKDIL